VSSRDPAIRLRDDRVLTYREYGDPNGAPALYFHGTPGCRLEASYFDHASRDAGVRLIAMDRPGYGASAHNPRLQFHTYSDDVAELVEALRLERFAVVALSGGVPYALATGVALAERINIICAISSATPPAARIDQQRPWLRPLYRAGFAAFPIVARPVGEVVARWLPKGPLPFVGGGRDPRRRGEWAEAFRPGGRGFAHDLRLHVRPWHFDLSALTVDVHLWHGEADRLAPVSTARWLAARLPRCTPRFPTGEGHELFRNHTAEIAAVAARASR
jgi:pimeloyl-ACP methyl ester carboxylesterase